MEKPADHGPLPMLLYGLTGVTGLVDAVSYLKLGHVFVANMTGNIVFLGLSFGGASDVSYVASLTATGAFFIGAVAGGRLGLRAGRHRGRLLAIACLLEIALVAGALGVLELGLGPDAALAERTMIVLLALAMGFQSATARRIGVPDLSTTVLTMTLTGIAADSRFAGGRNPNLARRLAAAGSMCLGAAVGAYCILRFGVAPVLVLATVLLVGVWSVGHRSRASVATWTAGC